MQRESVRQGLVSVGNEATVRTAMTIFAVIDVSRTATVLAALGATEPQRETTVMARRRGF